MRLGLGLLDSLHMGRLTKAARRLGEDRHERGETKRHQSQRRRDAIKLGTAGGEVSGGRKSQAARQNLKTAAKRGGQQSSPRKAAAARRNGKLGGRPPGR